MSMETTLFTKGFVLGVSIAAPVGPIGLLCLKRSLSGGMMNGLAAGLGAATADLMYGLLAVFGLGAVLSRFLSAAAWAEVAGGLFLSGSAAIFRRLVTPGWLVWINRISGTVVIAFGLRTLLTRW